MSRSRSGPSTGFPYAACALEVGAAICDVHAAARSLRDRRDDSDPATIAWTEALARFHAALDRAYPPEFWDAFEALRSGDPAGLEAAIDFLEGDPLFVRSGYVKADLIRLISRQPLTEDQARRLREIVLDIVDRRDGREFRRYCRLARHLDSPALRRDGDRAARTSDDARLGCSRCSKSGRRGPSGCSACSSRRACAHDATRRRGADHRRGQTHARVRPSGQSAEERSMMSAAETVTWSQHGRVWWLVFWRVIVMFLIMSVIGGALTAIAQDHIGFGPDTARVVYTALSLPVFGIAAYAAIWMALRKRFRAFGSRSSPPPRRGLTKRRDRMADAMMGRRSQGGPACWRIGHPWRTGGHVHQR